MIGIDGNLSSAIKDVYATIKNIDYEGKIYRKDIGATDLKKKKKGK